MLNDNKFVMSEEVGTELEYRPVPGFEEVRSNYIRMFHFNLMAEVEMDWKSLS